MALLQHGDHRERRFGTLVTAASSAGKAVAASAGSFVEQRNLGVVVAEEPCDAHLHAREPLVVAGNRRGAHARVCQRGHLGRPLIRSRSALTWAPSLRGYHGQVAAPGLSGQQPLKNAQSAAQHPVVSEMAARHDDGLSDGPVGVAEPGFRPGPRGIPSRSVENYAGCADDYAGPVEQRECGGMSGLPLKYLGRAERRECHGAWQW